MDVRGGLAVELTVVVSTYEWPEALDAVLRSLSEQSDPHFDVVVADDGSSATTAAVVERWREAFDTRLAHVWQPDEGFRLALALNRAALVRPADYFVFIHGESVPRRHFVRAMRRAALPGWFVAGRRVELSRALTERVLTRALPVHRWSFAHWLRFRNQARPVSALTFRDRRRAGARGLPEFVPHNRTYGYVLGVVGHDFRRVNGYDTRFEGWGEEDVDIAVRLRRIGLRCGHAGAHATLIHLWHPSAEERERRNWWLLQETEQTDRVEAVEGLRELGAEGAEGQLSANRVRASSPSSGPVKR